MKGYRGLLRELSRTRGSRALWLHLNAGFRHLLRAWARSEAGDGERDFIRHYAADGFALPDDEARRRALKAQACLVCGLCSAECARVGGDPAIDPQEGVVATTRLLSEAIRLEAGAFSHAPCGSCGACERVCPARIPIADVLDALLEAPSPPA